MNVHGHLKTNVCSVGVEWNVPHTTIKILLVDCIVQIYVPTDILPSSSISWWEVGIEVPNHNCAFVYFFFKFYQFLLHVFLKSVVFLCIHLELQCLPGDRFFM